MISCARIRAIATSMWLWVPARLIITDCKFRSVAGTRHGSSTASPTPGIRRWITPTTTPPTSLSPAHTKRSITARLTTTRPTSSRQTTSGTSPAPDDVWTAVWSKLCSITGRPKGVSFSVDTSNNTGTLTIPAGQPCPSGSVRSSATQCAIISDFTGGEVNARAFVLCDPNRRVADAPDGTPVLVDAACLARPTTRGEFGNASRNMLRRPGVINFDLAFFKNIRFREKVSLQFRWETYNLFNHTNFDDIDTNLTFARDATSSQIVLSNLLFGQPNSARSPRVMQGSLRLNF